MKIKLITSVFLVWIVSGYAQELTVKLSGGPSGIQYGSSMGDGSLELGGGIGVDYTYFLNDHWGILTGVEARYNQNSFELNDNQVLSSFEIDDQSSAFEYRVSPMSYQEDQHFYSFGIPLMLQYRTSNTNSTGIYIAVGAKVLFPGKQQIDASTDEMSLSGYYPDLDLEIDDLPTHGFGAVNNWEDDAKVSLKTSVLLSMEGGLTFKLKEGLKLYTGVYADYGLTDMQDNDSGQNLVSYSPESISMVAANGVMSTEDIIEDSNYLSAGIQVKLGFDLGNKKKTVIEEKTDVKEVVEQRQDPTPVVVEEVEEIPEEPSLTKEELGYIEEPLVFGTIDQTEVSQEEKDRLDKIAQLVAKDEKTTLQITGYTCDLGSEELNKRIGMERAESIATYLTEKGVSRDRMELESKGEAAPLVPNTSHENRVKNRRVSIKVMDN